MTTAEVRPLRGCDVCHQVDDHPRHTFFGPPEHFPVNNEYAEAILAMPDLEAADKNRIYRDALNTQTQERHMDCCKSVGCPDGSCDRVIATLSKGYVKGNALVKHLTSGKVDHIGEEINQARVGSEN